jgi:hypothetical protein
MVYSAKRETDKCIVCGSPANYSNSTFSLGGAAVDCVRCGDFDIQRIVIDDFHLPLTDPKQLALACHQIRKLQGRTRPKLDKALFHNLLQQSLPTPAEANDNVLLDFVDQADGRPGKLFGYLDEDLLRILGQTGVVDNDDLEWHVETLRHNGLIELVSDSPTTGRIMARGWQRAEELRRAHVSSRFAFFARRFANPNLDLMFEQCLAPAVAQTGFELRTVTQVAGLIDSIIEDEIRRCRFLIADLSDNNAGAYWEAGFAEGLSKPVIYICADKDEDGNPKSTHFDTDHRHTVRWDLSNVAQTAQRLKAVIRNTLLGDAVQED